MSRTKTNRKHTGSIKCCDWQATYIDETGRNLSTGLTEYKRETRKWWRQQSFTYETSNRLGLCDMYYPFHRLLSTTHSRKLIYWLRTNATALYRHRTNDILSDSSKTNYEKMTGQPTIWLTINDCLTGTIDGSKRTNKIASLIANNITA